MEFLTFINELKDKNLKKNIIDFIKENNIQIKEKHYNSFKPFQIKARVFTNKYLKFYDDYIKDEINKLNELMNTKDFLKGINKNDSVKIKEFFKRLEQFIEVYPEYQSIVNELLRKQRDSIIEFLEDEQNAKELLDILFEPFEIDHNPKTKDEYNSYMQFMKECYDFFLNKLE